jgi:hypothetical protein
VNGSWKEGRESSQKIKKIVNWKKLTTIAGGRKHPNCGPGRRRRHKRKSVRLRRSGRRPSELRTRIPERVQCPFRPAERTWPGIHFQTKIELINSTSNNHRDFFRERGFLSGPDAEKGGGRFRMLRSLVIVSSTIDPVSHPCVQFLFSFFSSLLFRLLLRDFLFIPPPPFESPGESSRRGGGGNELKRAATVDIFSFCLSHPVVCVSSPIKRSEQKARTERGAKCLLPKRTRTHYIHTTDQYFHVWVG